MGIRTAICELLGVEHPVGNAGMAGVAHARLCAAVADAGGIAAVAMGGASAAEVTTRVEAVKALTDWPFSANFIAWLIEHDPSPLDAALEAGVASVTLSFGDPAPYIDRIHSAGSLLLDQVQTVEAARRAVETGVDVIIAQGNDAGGHTGLIPLLPFLPQVVDVAGDVPVLAAGGIGDGRGLAAALVLGAQGGLMGTRFIASNEAESDWPRLPGQVLDASVDDSVWTTAIDIHQGGGRSRWPSGIGARSIRTQWLDRWSDHPDELSDLLAHDPDADHAEGHDPTPAYAGPVAGMVTEHEPAARIVESVVADAARVLDSSRRLVERR
ncbi:NAD(P)H-dependent flavin oxidoreductase [Ilumatobacter sp.]|uniref:NAD(P)H-dependent flavin oxidoreductase n=1 Tax=Ilumatobacter sp. TaxID=1967498 RepID=UPI003B5192CB